MTFTYLLLAFVNFLGCIIGSIISNYTKEELKTGKKYFRIIRPFLFSVIVYLFLYDITNSKIASIIVSALSILIYIGMSKFSLFYHHFIASFLSVVLYETMEKYALYVSLITFFLFVLNSSIFFRQNKNIFSNIIRALKYHITYLVSAMLIFLVFRI